MPLLAAPQQPPKGIMAGLTQPSPLTPSPTAASTSQSQPQIPARRPSPLVNLPAPQTFDILPPLHELLARIDHAPSQGGDLSPTSEDDGDAIGARYLKEHIPALEPKDLPTEVLPLKAKIRKCLRELEKLPDMDRSVAEQRAELAELEERKARQEDVLRRLAGLAEGMRGRLATGR